MTSNLSRPVRPDVQRNRTKILLVAERSFSELGVEASLDGIAKAAGVGPGTLYRHFPTRDELVAAVLMNRWMELVNSGEQIKSEESDSRVALDRWLAAVSEWMRTYEGLPRPLRTAYAEPDSALAPTCQDVIRATDEFLSAAQRDGYARADTRGLDLYLGTLAVVWASAADASLESALHLVLRQGWLAPEVNS